MSESGRIIKAMCKAGLDILELGIPFSDPTADGPVIQRSSGRALAGGMTLKIALDMTRDIRQTTDIPIILFSYYNPIHAYGNRKFYTDAVNAGADGVLIVDLPPEESDEMTSTWAGKDLSLIRLIAPTTPKERMKQIADSASGFLYLVSKTGVTGSAGLNTSEVGTHVRTLRSVSNLPICVGFGISTADDVKAVAKVADGVVIGSAYEKLIEENLRHSDLPGLLSEKTMVYKAATKVS
jgi:tryptophan synthase alpha chain